MPSRLDQIRNFFSQSPQMLFSAAALFVALGFYFNHISKNGLLSPISLYEGDCDPKNPDPNTNFFQFLYFFIVTISTVGYGDLKPCDAVARWCVLVSILVLTLIFAYFMAYVSKVLEKVESAIAKRLGKTKFGATFVAREAPNSILPLYKIYISIGVILVVNLFNAVLAAVVEGLDFTEAVYFSVITTTTVGYGDFSFKSTLGRSAAIVWLLTCTSAVTMAYSYIAQASLLMMKKKTLTDVLSRHFGYTEFNKAGNLTRQDWLTLEDGKEAKITESQYALFILKECNIVNDEVLGQIRAKFNTIAIEGKIRHNHLYRL